MTAPSETPLVLVLCTGNSCRSHIAEIGIDIFGHRSKHLDDLLSQDVDTVITVCGKADQVCPMFLGQVNRHHWGFDDPAHATGTEEEKMEVFRRVRDEIARVFRAYAAGRLDEAKRQKNRPPNIRGWSRGRRQRFGFSKLEMKLSFSGGDRTEFGKDILANFAPLLAKPIAFPARRPGFLSRAGFIFGIEFLLFFT